MSLWEERAARNEALFREVNERMLSLAGGHAEPEETGFVCECSTEGCTRRLHVPVQVYEAVRADPRHFLVTPGHEGPFERVVEQGEGFTIVEKEGEAGEIAEETDPRS